MCPRSKKTEISYYYTVTDILGKPKLHNHCPIPLSGECPPGRTSTTSTWCPCRLSTFSSKDVLTMASVGEVAIPSTFSFKQFWSPSSFRASSITAPSSRRAFHVSSAIWTGAPSQESLNGLESRFTSWFCPMLRFLIIIPSCRECSNLRSDLDKKVDVAFIGQSGGTIERI